jgi:hypothetical protein
MDTSLVKSVVTVAVGSLAYYVLTAAALPWAPLLAPERSGYLAIQLANTAGLLLVSAPFAAVLTWPRMSLRFPALLALCVSLFGLVLPLLPSVELVLRPGAPGISAAVDLLKFMLVLPALTWLLARRLPSNNSSKPTPLRGAA